MKFMAKCDYCGIKFDLGFFLPKRQWKNQYVACPMCWESRTILDQTPSRVLEFNKSTKKKFFDAETLKDVGKILIAVFLTLGILSFFRCVSYQDRPLSKPSQEQLAPQEGDDVLITEEDGIDVGMLREALKAEADVKMLEGNAEEDKQYYVDVIDEANQRIVLVSLVSSAVVIVLLIFK